MLRAADNPEIEPNDAKAAATVVTLAPADSISGTTTGSSTTNGGLGSADYFRVRTSGAATGIQRYRLTRDTPSPNVNAMIRGRSQSGGVPNASSDLGFQTQTSTPPFVQWYGFGAAEEIYFRVTGTSATSTVYRYTLSRQSESALAGPANLQAGNITIARAGHTTDIDFWVYDSVFHPIATFGNDGQNTLTRAYGPGTYYVAMSNFNLANDLGNASDDTVSNTPVLDFPGAVAASSALQSLNVSTSFSDAGGVQSVSATKAGAFDIVFIAFTVVDPPAACCFTATNTCALLASIGCSAAGGDYMGAGTTCASDPCPRRCCLADDACLLTDAAACAALGGAAGAVGTNCQQFGVERYFPHFPEMNLPDNTTVTDAQVISDNFAIANLDVSLQITHTFLADLSIRLAHAGTTVTLWSRDCASNNNLDVTFSDSGSALICTADITGSISPATATSGEYLSAFEGLNMHGDWTLSVEDNFAGGTGTLHRWTLIATPYTCAGPPRACCFPAGNCLERLPATCAEIGGETQAEGTTCIPNSCPQARFDYFELCGESWIAFGGAEPGAYPAIPAGFFSPGSDAFAGAIELVGDPLNAAEFGATCVISRRASDPFLPQDPNGIAVIPTEVAGLRLRSATPITSHDGALTQQWNVTVELSAVSPDPGSLAILKWHSNGGEAYPQFAVQPRFTFFEVGGGAQRELDAGALGLPPLLLAASAVGWVHHTGPGISVVSDPESALKQAVRERFPGDALSQATESFTADALPRARLTLCPPAGRRCIYHVTCVSGSECGATPTGIGGFVVGGPCEAGCGVELGERWSGTNCCIRATYADCAFTNLPLMPRAGEVCACAPSGACCLSGGCVGTIAAADCAAGGGFYHGDGAPCPSCDDGIACTNDTCDPATGACVHTGSFPGTPCADDGNACTFDFCDGAGACIHPPVSSGLGCADDGNPCTDDMCDGFGGCVHVPTWAGAPCLPDDSCTSRFCDGLGACVELPLCEPCCLPDDSCVVMPAGDCFGNGGTPLGSGATCAAGSCADTPCPGALPGDANCDGGVNNFDIDFFVQGLLLPPPPDVDPAPVGYFTIGGTQACWEARRCWGDIDCDGALNNFDIDPFVACILALPPAGTGCAACGLRACCQSGLCELLLPAACVLRGGVPISTAEDCAGVDCVGAGG